MLTWHNAWMAGHGRELAREVRAVGSAVAAGDRPLTAVAVVVGVAVLREGSEVVLFLYGIIAAGGTSVTAMMAGGAFGVVLGAALSALIYLGLLAVPAQRSVRGHHRADHAARGRACGAGGILPAAGRLPAGPGHAAMGYVLAARRRQHPGAAAAHADRLHRDAGWRAVARLCAGYRLDAGDDAPGAWQERHLAPDGALFSLTAAPPPCCDRAGRRSQWRWWRPDRPRRVTAGAQRGELRMKVYRGWPQSRRRGGDG